MTGKNLKKELAQEAEALLRILEHGKRQVKEGKFMPAKQAIEQLRQRARQPPED
ncbi:MAG: hypothetical protein OEY97_13700 [Nitrospirota bacterium]|nr:hypothetical protein [Nitrospirota bacterium]